MRTAWKTHEVADLRPSGPWCMGREAELALLLTLSEPDGPSVALVHGPAGMGKTTLLREARDRLTQAGMTVPLLRGGVIEPTPEGFLEALAEALGQGARSLGGLLRLLGRPGAPPTTILVDETEALHLLATWLRREFAPRLPAAARLILAGRVAPPPAWERDLPGQVVRLTLGPLPREATEALARAAGRDPGAAWRRSGGHPLALALLLRSGETIRDPSPAGLARELLRSADDPALVSAVEATSVLRRLTRPLLSAVAADLDAEGTLTALASLPFVEQDEEGLRLAEPVRAAEAARLAALHPDRLTLVRSRAARALAEKLASAPGRERWRAAADLLFLVPVPELRGAFFPPEAPLPVVDLARREDAVPLDALAGRQNEAVGAIARLWREALPHRVWVARDDAGRPLAFHVYARSEDDLGWLSKRDPLLAAWRGHQQAQGGSRTAIFLRLLAQVAGREGETARAACILDLKRAYIERRALGRVYIAAGPEEMADPVLRQLGFRPFTALGSAPDSMLLDMGAQGFDSWIVRLAGLEAGPENATAGFELDRGTRELRAGEHRATLTRLEAEVLAALMEAAPRPVGREALIETVWRRTVVGSNVVDAVIRTLRAKLGPHRDLVQTVPGLGYRLRSSRPEFE